MNSASAALEEASGFRPVPSGWRRRKRATRPKFPPTKLWADCFNNYGWGWYIRESDSESGDEDDEDDEENEDNEERVHNSDLDDENDHKSDRDEDDSNEETSTNENSSPQHNSREASPEPDWDSIVKTFSALRASSNSPKSTATVDNNTSTFTMPKGATDKAGVARSRPLYEIVNNDKKKVAYFYDSDIGNYAYVTGHPMKPHRIRLAHSLVMNYDVYKFLEIYVSFKISC